MARKTAKNARRRTNLPANRTARIAVCPTATAFGAWTARRPGASSRPSAPCVPESGQATEGNGRPFSESLWRACPGLVNGRRCRLATESRPRRHVNTRFRLVRSDHDRAERLRARAVLVDGDSRRTRIADRGSAIAAARHAIRPNNMLRRPSGRTCFVAQLEDARQKSVTLGERADLALISTRPGGHAGHPVALQGSRVSLNRGRPRFHRRTGSPGVIGRCHRQ
jgi:hypothetical protein